MTKHSIFSHGYLPKSPQNKLIDYCLLMFVVFGACLNIAQASPDQAPTAGTLYLSNQQSLSREAINLETDVKMNISGLTARVTVTQIFENDSDQWVEGKYLFPLPEKAAVDHLTMKIGERIIVGEIKEKQEAKKIYEQAKISGRKASLVEQQRANIFSNSVANIAPYERIEITIEYQQDVIYQKEQGFSIRFPMTITPRYHPAKIVKENFERIAEKSDSINLFSQVSESRSFINDEKEETFNRVTMSIALDAGFGLLSLNSETHKLNKQQKSESSYHISFEEERVKTDRDFILAWNPTPSGQPRAAIFTEDKQLKNGDQEEYISLMILPPSTSQITGFSNESDNLINRETIFVIDTSGSMAGESIRQAKDSLSFALTTLREGDNFNIVEFNSQTSKLFSTAKKATPSNINVAKLFVDQLEANGGTEMLAAIEASLDGKDKHTLMRQVIFLTDGAIGNESELFSLIDNRLGDSRLFTVGIGSAPNTFFMKKAASFGRGTFTFISSSKDSREKMSQLFRQISQPQLTHINIEWPDSFNADVWPKRMPDLYDGEPLWVKAKIDNGADSQDGSKGVILVSGRVGDTLWQSSLSANNASQESGVAVLWAREKIESIMNSAYHGQVDDQQKQEIIDTAIKHHIVSRYTSLIAVDKTPARIAEQLQQKIIKNHLPKGSQKRKLNQSALSYPNTSLDLDVGSNGLILLFLTSFIGLIVIRVRGS